MFKLSILVQMEVLMVVDDLYIVVPALMNISWAAIYYVHEKIPSILGCDVKEHICKL
jgi:hypothetical protein